MPLHESIEYFPLFDVEQTGDGPTTTTAVGDRVAALGSPNALGGAGAVAIYCYSKDRNAWGYVGVITGSKETGPNQVRAMGSSLTAVGGTLIVGARGDDSTPGKVFVLAAPYGVWSYTTVPVITEVARKGSAAGDFFGASIAHCFDGQDDYLAVGAPGATAPPGYTGTGQIFVFKGLGPSVEQWSQAAIGNPSPTGAATDRFGSCLALGATGPGRLVLAVGAPGAREDQGEVHVARTSEGSTTFVFGPALQAAFPEIPDMDEPFTCTAYGSAVALAGSTLLVGAPDDPNFEAEIEGTGAVWMYQDTDGAFELLEERLYGPVESSRFGHSLAIAGDEVVVGAPGVAVAYRCRRAGDGFARDEALVRINGKRADDFGMSVAASSYPNGTWFLVAAPGDASAGMDSGGFLYAEGDTQTWMESPKLVANPPVRWGGLNHDWWKKFTPGVETYVAAFMAQPEEIRQRALASASEGLG
jgi:hypothetical protein